MPTEEAKYSYTCQVCRAFLESSKEVPITLGISPVCSLSCKFKVIYGILNEYSDKEIETLYVSCLSASNPLKTRQLMLFALCKFYSRRITPNIALLAQGSEGLELAQKSELAQGSGSRGSLGTLELSRRAGGSNG